jgi:hypothetical protein
MGGVVDTISDFIMAKWKNIESDIAMEYDNAMAKSQIVSTTPPWLAGLG